MQPTAGLEGPQLMRKSLGGHEGDRVNWEKRARPAITDVTAGRRARDLGTARERLQPLSVQEPHECHHPKSIGPD